MDQIGTVELSAYFILASLLFFPENSSFPHWILPQVFSQPASRSGSQPGTPSLPPLRAVLPLLQESKSCETSGELAAKRILLLANPYRALH